MLRKSIRVVGCLYIICAAGIGHIVAQDYPRKDIDIDAFVQQLFAFQDADINYDDLYESLYLLYTNPLDLNRASREDLASLFILSEAQINNIMAHIAKNGRMLSIYELQTIEGLDLPTIYLLLPFVTVLDEGNMSDNRPIWQRIRDEENQYLLLRTERTLQEKTGYTPADIDTTTGQASTRYEGSPYKMFSRYRVSHSQDFSFGFTLEKDPGEKLSWQPHNKVYGVDFFSFHGVIYNKRKFKALAVGDYQVQIGQGMILSAGFQVGKGAETVATLRRNTRGILPYASVLEGNFFRGGAATYSINKQLDATLFYSNRNVDASSTSNLSRDSLELSEDVFGSVQITGFHRTPAELASKGQLNEQNLGGHVQYKSSNQKLTAGITALNTLYGSRIEKRPSSYNQFDFQGSNNLVMGANIDYNMGNLTFFGEAARSQSGGIGLIGGVVASLSKHVDFALHLRSYDRDFHAFYGNSMGEKSRSANEMGMYWGIKIKPNRKWTLAAYYDRFKFPWLSYLSDAPSTGYEYLARLTFAPTKKISMYTQIRAEEKARNLQDNVTKIDYVVPSQRVNYWFNVDVKATEIISLKSRVQFSTYQQEDGPTSHGYTILQDISFEFGNFDISTRFALFDADDYNNRQYVYEKDVLYAVSIPAYAGKGFRNYWVLHYRVSRKIDVWGRIAFTNYLDQNTIGSGLDTIEGNKRTDVKAQVRYRF